MFSQFCKIITFAFDTADERFEKSINCLISLIKIFVLSEFINKSGWLLFKIKVSELLFELLDKISFAIF